MRVLSSARTALMVVLVAASGCAAREGKFASRFVKPGEPTATYDDPNVPAPQPPALSDYVRKVRALQSKAVPKNSLLPTIESSNPDLSRALLLLSMYESSENHRLAAAAYRKAGVLDFAYRHFQRASLMEPCDAVSHDGMARLWRDWGMSDLRVERGPPRDELQQEVGGNYNTLGTVLESLGQQAAAERAYQTALALNPRAIFALNNLCYLQMIQDHGPAAARSCEAALAIDPNFAPARNNLALVQARSGDVAGAEKRLRDGSPSGFSLYNIGVLRLTEGRFAEAALVFDRRRQRNPC